MAVNYTEEGSEPDILDGDTRFSAALCECASEANDGVRDLNTAPDVAFGESFMLLRIAACQSQLCIIRTPHASWHFKL